MYNYNRRRTRSHKGYLLNTLIITAAAAVIVLAALSLKGETEVPTESESSENHSSYYNPNDNSSQETGQVTAGITQPTATPKPTQKPSPSPSPTVKETYLVTIHEGKIAAFKNDDPEPVLISGISVSLLPEEDQALLKEGITADSMPAVRAILEDYE